MHGFLVRIAGVLGLALWVQCPALATDVRARCPAEHAPDHFFARGALASTNPGEDQTLRQWYSSQLDAMGERSLSCGTEAAEEAYRFTWLRTFHHPIMVRISRTEGAVSVRAVELSGAGGYRPGQVWRATDSPLNANQWTTLQGAISQARLWRLPTRDASNRGLDGAEWVFEARRHGQYRVVSRWTPPAGAYRQLGLLFLQLAGLVIPQDEIY